MKLLITGGAGYIGKNLTNFISSMFPENTIKSTYGIKNDKSWSATEALTSL